MCDVYLYYCNRYGLCEMYTCITVTGMVSVCVWGGGVGR